MQDLQTVGDRAAPYSQGFIAQILQVSSDGKNGELLGTGNILRTDSGFYLLTAMHVPATKKDGPLAYAIGNGVRPEVITNRWLCIGEPSDIAVVRIDPPSDWPRGWITLDMFAAASSVDPTVDFHHIHGFTASRSRFTAFAKGVLSETLNYTTVNGTLPAGFDPAIHLAIEYPNDDQLRADGRMVGLPDPGGLSGGIIWRTNYCANSASWSADLMTIAGIAIRWSQIDGRIIGTRVEVVAEIVRRLTTVG